MILVRHAMTGNPYCVKPSTSVRETAETMISNGLETIMVVDGETIYGAVTIQDILRYTIHPAFQCDNVTIDEITDPEIVLLRPSTTIQDAVQIMTETGRITLPVVDRELRGYLSLTDILTVQPNQEVKTTNYIT